MKRIKNQKGAISLFVLLSMLFFLVFVLGAYTLVSRRVQTQTMTLTDLRSIYKEDAQSMSYAKYAKEDEVIPVYNAEQFMKIGSNEYIEVNGKIYKFGTNDTSTGATYSYILRGNIIIDIDEYFSQSDVSKIEFLDSKFYNDNYQIDKAEYDLYYYKEDKDSSQKAYWKLVTYQDSEKILFTSDEKTEIGKTAVLGDDKYSILNNLDKYIYDSNYEFLLMYNEEVNGIFDVTKYNWWKQSGNPLKISESSATELDSTVDVSGYEAVKISLDTAIDANYWGGLILSNSSESILDGSTYSTANHYSVGITSKYNNGSITDIDDDGIKTGDGTTASKVYLFARVEVGDLGEKEVSLAKKIKIGDYILYTPSDSSVTNSIDTKYTGTDSIQTITQAQKDNWIKYWRVIDKNESTGAVTLISETPTNETLTLSGARGYNNGVYLLNNICKSLWSNGYKAIARSITLEDIEKFSNYDKTTSTTYEKTAEYTTNLYYPNLYSKIADGKIDGQLVENGLEQSEQEELLDEETTQATTSIFVNSNVYELDTNSYLTTDIYKTLLANGYSYWIATRSHGIAESEAEFGLFRMNMDSSNNLNKVQPFMMYKSSNTPDSLELGIRPVIEIEDSVTWDGVGDGTKENPYGIIF